MSLDDDVQVVSLATRFSDFSRDEQADAALDRILAALDDAISERDSAYALLTDKQGTLDAAEKRARVAEAMSDWLAGRATMIERELGKQPTWDSSDDWLAASREAVESDPTEYGQTRIVPVERSEG